MTPIVRPNGQPVISQQAAVEALIQQQFRNLYLGIVVSLAGREDTDVDSEVIQEALCETAYSLARAAMRKIGVEIV